MVELVNRGISILVIFNSWFFPKKKPLLFGRGFLLYILKNLKFGNSTLCRISPHFAIHMTNNIFHFSYFLMLQTSELFLDLQHTNLNFNIYFIF